MEIRQLAKVVPGWIRTRSGCARAAVPLLAVPARRPWLALRWLAGARAAQVALVAGVLLIGLGLPALLDATLPHLYPDVMTETKLLGFIKTEKPAPDPRLEERRWQVMVLGSLAGAAGVFFLLCACLPEAIHEAACRARQHEQQADALASTDPERSRALYRSAARITPEPEHEAILWRKSRAPDEAQARAGNPSSAETIVSPVSAPSIQPETQPDRYRLVSELARGGMGAVYRGHDELLGRPVALKQLLVEFSGNADLVDRFRQEARALARLTHPNIVQVHDLVEQDDRWWIVMELVEGGDLGDLIKREGPLAPAQIAKLAVPISRALAYAHANGVVHRDVKPENVLLTVDEVPKLTDFGLAKLLESEGRTRVGSVLGSPSYMSPEQAAGEPADESSDIYSLGVTLYQMLVGHVPFAGDTAAVLAKHITAPPQPPRELDSDIPQELEQLVLEMLSKQKVERPPDLSTVGDRLVAFSKES